MNTHTPFRAPLAALLLASSALAAAGGPPIEERRPLAADGKLSIHNVAGEILVRGWDRDEVYLLAQPGDSFERLEITGDREHLTIRVRVDDDDDNIDETDLTLQIPHAAALSVNAVSGDIEAAGLSGPLDLQTVSGDVELAGESPRLKVHTVSGDIEVSAPSSDTDLTSVSGDIRARRLNGRLVAETVSGSVDAAVEAAEIVEAQSVSGDIDLVLELVGNADVSAQTLSGDVRLHLPLSSSVRAAMKTFSGDLRTKGFERPGRGETRHRFSVNGGRASVDLNSFSGDVEVIGE